MKEKGYTYNKGSNNNGIGGCGGSRVVLVVLVVALIVVEVAVLKIVIFIKHWQSL